MSLPFALAFLVVWLAARLYASAQLEGGVSVKSLSINLGHHDPGFTLRVYTHLMPSSGDKSPKAANSLFKPKKRVGEVEAG